MCMEDVQIGRATQTTTSLPTLGTADTLLVRANAQRWGLTFCPPSSGVVWIQPGVVGVRGVGYALTAGDLPLRLRVQHDGDVVTEEWHAVADAGAPTMRVIDTWLRAGT